jgi:hypothetical protein
MMSVPLSFDWEKIHPPGLQTEVRVVPGRAVLVSGISFYLYLWILKLTYLSSLPGVSHGVTRRSGALRDARNTVEEVGSPERDVNGCSILWRSRDDTHICLIPCQWILDPF